MPAQRRRICKRGGTDTGVNGEACDSKDVTVRMEFMGIDFGV
jgi:hypothetical protein